MDIAVALTGAAANVVALAVANNMSITQILIAGETVVIPNDVSSNIDIVNYYNKFSLTPATGQTYIDGNVLFENGLFENGLFQ